MRAVKFSRLEGGSIGPRTESSVNWDGPMAIVPCLHQGIIYTKRKLRVWTDQKYISLVDAITPLNGAKRKLRVWRDQKCISLVDAITPLNGAGRQNTPSRRRQHRSQNGKLRKLSRTYLHGTVFAPRKYFTKRKLRVWKDQKCIPLVGAITPLNGVGRQITPSRGRQYRAKNGK